MRRPDLDDLPPMRVPDGFELREILPGEDQALTDLLSAAFGEAWTVEGVRRALIDAPDVKNTYVLVQDGRLVATASARLVPDRFPGAGYVHWVGADPQMKGRRLGQIVSLRTLYRFRELGCRDAVLQTDDHRLPALRTYFALGFLPEPACPTHPARWKHVFEELGRPRG